MVLSNVSLANGDVVDILISGDKIVSVSKHDPEKKEASRITFEKAIAFPGLINSHDHLEFNLFPQLGNKFYKNYTEWGKYLHKNYKNEINDILKIPIELRAQWGMYKNLLCGVTTVVNHGNILDIYEPLITIFQKCY